MDYKVAIFDAEQKAVNFADAVHQFLLQNRQGYNATGWAATRKGDADEWMVQVPGDYQELKMDLNSMLNGSPVTEIMPEAGEIVEGEYYLLNGKVLKADRTFTKQEEDSIDDNFTQFKEPEIISK